jgi:hypothetical protein
MKTTITQRITVTYSCGHSKVFGVWQEPERECWCHAPAVTVEINVSDSGKEPGMNVAGLLASVKRSA